MTTKLSLLSFLISLFLGTLSFSVFEGEGLSKNNCRELKKVKKQRILFTLKNANEFEEGSQIKQKRLFPNKAGRVGRLEMINRDKALLTIYWEDRSNKNGETVILYDKKEFESLEVID